MLISNQVRRLFPNVNNIMRKRSKLIKRKIFIIDVDGDSLPEKIGCSFIDSSNPYL